MMAMITLRRMAAQLGRKSAARAEAPLLSTAPSMVTQKGITGVIRDLRRTRPVSRPEKMRSP
jgi:hypothetical protein